MNTNTHQSVTHAVADLRDHPVDERGFARSASMAIADLDPSAIERTVLRSIIDQIGDAAQMHYRYLDRRHVRVTITKNYAGWVRLVLHAVTGQVALSATEDHPAESLGYGS